MNDIDLFNRIANNGIPPLTGDDGNPVALPNPGETVDTFRCIETIGNGGVGTIYKAVDLISENIKAIKVLYPKSTRRDVDRFITEAKICLKLDHPNIIHVSGLGYIKGVLPYAIMELIDGGSLQERLKQNPPLPCPVALSIISLLCQALEYIHSREITIDGKTYSKLVHRDIKPNNILISDKGSVKLADFGLAKFEGIDLHTVAGVLPGTLPYMAPEQHQSPIANAATDIYALGVTLYEMVTKHRPFPETGSDAFVQMVHAKANEIYTPVPELGVDAHPHLGNIISRCLKADPKKRYSTYASLRMAVESSLQDYIRLDPDAVVTLYFANRKQYDTGIPKTAGRVKYSVRSRLYLTITLMILIATAGITVVITKSALQSKKTSTHQTVNKSIPADSSAISITDTSPENQLKDKNARLITKTVDKTSQTAVKINKVDTGRPPDPLAEGVSAYKKGRFQDAISILTVLSFEHLQSDTKDSATIILIESYYRLGKINEALMLASTSSINDSKYFLLLGLLYEVAAMRNQAIASFNNALTAPDWFDPTIRTTIYLYRARFMQRIYMDNENENSKSLMLQAWNDFLLHGCQKNTPECDEARRIIGIK